MYLTGIFIYSNQDKIGINEFILRSQKIKNATKSPAHQIAQKAEFNGFILVIFCVLVFWWQKIIFELDSIIKSKNEKNKDNH